MRTAQDPGYRDKSHDDCWGESHINKNQGSRR